jgi:hypothetical protein
MSAREAGGNERARCEPKSLPRLSSSPGYFSINKFSEVVKDEADQTMQKAE